MSNSLILSMLEPAGQARTSEFIRIGIPLPAGQFYDKGEIQLLTSEKLLSSERTPTAFWPDNSIKWCLLEFFLSLDKHENKKIFLRKNSNKSQSGNANQLIIDNTETVEVKTKNYCFHLNKKSFNLFDRIINDTQTIAEKGFCRLVKSNNESLKAIIKEFHYRSSHSEQSPLYSEISMTGQFQNPSGSIEINFEALVDFYFDSDQVKYTITLHNPNRASHPSGIWDLGDINSFLIQDFSLGFEMLDKTDVRWKAEPDHNWNNLKSHKLEIYQESSGGENWDSPNHKNKDNRVPMQQKGYICQYDQKTDTGARANPVISIGSKAGRINVMIEKFWQNFPKSLGINENKVELGLFPQKFPDNIELQPGEKKTHFFYLSLGEKLDAACKINAPISTSLNTDWIKQCKVFPYLFSNAAEDPIEEIIKEGLSSKDNFFVKREKIDEYGWRNFGDLYADHEADLYQGEDIFISHYNNQYDSVYGFLHQYLLTGENKWFQLADEQAKHITDIDIYHTDKDRGEYNGGAFWHTDHYVDASTSSHRSYSKNQVYIYDEEYVGGGGPAGEHCYTTGLLYHYLLTGSESSKKAVLQLSNWITNIYEGSDTLFDLLIGIKNLKTGGLKNILTDQYSLDRGTGYYLNALLNKFFLTQEKTVLQQVGYIIRHTVHPLDDIDARNLGDIERNWFYTIFLQYVYSYLQTKEELSELDDDFYYARDTLLHYADWMLKNEYPYLEKPEILDFPNHTWTAQDLRKVNILYFAAYYTDKQQEAYINKAAKLLNYIVDNLSMEPTRTYTRILVILMQNYIPGGVHNIRANKNNFGPIREYNPLKPSTRRSLAGNLLSKLFHVARHFSIKNEISWLNKRTQVFSRFFGDI